MLNKRILCHSLIFGKKCNYGDKCLYAHTLDEQNVDKYRKMAYQIILDITSSYNQINLVENQNLYKTLLSLGKVCDACNQNLCHGGYNCRFGACNKQLQLCITDLNTGKCIYGDKCIKIHLTKRGMLPYDVQKENYKLKKQRETEKKILARFVEKYLVLTDPNDSD